MPETDIVLHIESDFEGMRKAGRLAARTLDFITPFVKPGISTNELDRLCHVFIIDQGGIPAPLGYKGYPKSICTSVNHVVCHGIPGDDLLMAGGIVNIDVTVIVDGWHGDVSRMFALQPLTLRAQKLVDVTRSALDQAIACVRPGTTLGDIGHAIQSWVEKFGFSVVRDYCGHGIGRVFHSKPAVMHYGQLGAGLVLQPGMFFTIEPMINACRQETRLLSDGWTVVTRDRSLSAQFEHTIGVTHSGCEVFTV